MTDPDDYTIRLFEAGDAQEFVDIFNQIWPAEKTTDWFEWRDLDNPSVEVIPGYVAEYEGDIGETVCPPDVEAYRTRKLTSRPAPSRPT